jgi:predicted nucleic acid-binding protein
MPLDLPRGAICFVDANIIYYHFVETVPLSEPCTALLEFVASSGVRGFTAVHVPAEAVHKVMLAEAAQRFKLDRAGLVNWLQRHRHRVIELSEFKPAAFELLQSGLSILHGDAELVAEAAEISARFSLLTNDAMIVALMRRHGIGDLITNDDDFDRIPDLTVHKPR